MLIVVVAAKRISPLTWGWYGNVQRSDGIAIRGYDAVAYFDGTPIEGSDKFTSERDGATWRFATAAHKATFDANPDQFTPQFGGFCSYAASKGFTATIDPTAFRVENGKLYLFNDAGMRDKWVAELPAGVIDKTAKNWQKRLSAQ